MVRDKNARALSIFSQQKTIIPFAMSKALVTALVIVLVAGVFIGEGEALLRAGRGMGKLQERLEEKRGARGAPDKLDTPYCITSGKGNTSEALRRPSEHFRRFPKIIRKLPKFNEDPRNFPKNGKSHSKTF